MKKMILTGMLMLLVGIIPGCRQSNSVKSLNTVSRELKEKAEAEHTEHTANGAEQKPGEAAETQNVHEQAPQSEVDAFGLYHLERPAALADRDEQLLERKGYAASYNKKLRLPNWVAWELTADHVTGPYKRSGIKYQEDTEVPRPRATHQDYYSSGYDRGHMCPSGDNKWDMQAQQQSFLLTNMCPQAHSLNAGDWNELEMKCRTWARRYGSLYIVCGPILYRRQHKTIGRNKVTVPEAFFKVVLRMEPQPCAIGFVYKNDDGNRPMGDYINSVDQVERITGIDFFPSLPDELEERIEAEASLDEWR